MGLRYRGVQHTSALLQFEVFKTKSSELYAQIYFMSLGFRRLLCTVCSSFEVYTPVAFLFLIELTSTTSD